MKLLIVDDSNLVRNSLKRYLRDTEIDRLALMEAANGQAALECFLKEQPDFMILDLLMPVLDGLGVLKHLESLDHQCHITVLSSNIQQPVKEECFALGCKLFLEKPITLEKFDHYLKQSGIISKKHIDNGLIP